MSFKSIKSSIRARLKQIMITKTRRVIDKAYFGKSTDSFNVDNVAILSAAISSANYVSANMKDAQVFRTNFDLIEFACKKARRDGLKVEFGVFSGATINHIALNIEDAVFGFDSFKGLPEDWRHGFDKGMFLMENLPKVRDNVQLVVGLFSDTLTEFMKQHNTYISLAHIDCDLYSSTKTIFENISDNIGEGTILIFDEYFNYPGWEVGEYAAFKEFVEEYATKYRYIGYVPSHQQVAVEIESVGKARRAI